MYGKGSTVTYVVLRAVSRACLGWPTGGVTYGADIPKACIYNNALIAQAIQGTPRVKSPIPLFIFEAFDEAKQPTTDGGYWPFLGTAYDTGDSKYKLDWTGTANGVSTCPIEVLTPPPTLGPTTRPTSFPTHTPTSVDGGPTTRPTTRPTSFPTLPPTSIDGGPTTRPTTRPTSFPTRTPLSAPSVGVCFSDFYSTNNISTSQAIANIRDRGEW